MRQTADGREARKCSIGEPCRIFGVDPSQRVQGQRRSKRNRPGTECSQVRALGVTHRCKDRRKEGSIGMRCMRAGTGTE